MPACSKPARRLIALLLCAPGAWCATIRPGALWPDNRGVHINAHGGGVLPHQGVFYWFGEHKIEGKNGNLAMVGVHCYSSKNLVNWTDEGIALRVADDATSEIAAGSVIERPKVIFNAGTGKFVMWFHLELKGQGYNAARTGLAVADRVTGPYRYVRSLRPNAGTWPINMPAARRTGPLPEGPIPQGSKEWLAAIQSGAIVRRDFKGGQMSRDMTLFVDDDGAAYHITASEENGTLHISRLSDDYQSFSGRWIRAFPGGHNEAPAVFKHNGKYFLIASGCTGWTPNAARSAVAGSMLGEWRALGNPARGTPRQNETTFESQSTYVLRVRGAHIFMADRWRPGNPIDGRYVWLPIQWEEGKPVLKWSDEWSPSDLQ